jgi:DNA-directed RNA polymerase sigma subunit (sigma70/sigma32)
LNPEKIYAGAMSGGDLDNSLFTPVNEGHLFRQEALEVLSRNLSDREYDILCRRFGLGGYGCQTLADIALVYGKSTEHIRSVVNKCMGKLKENRELRDFCSSWEIV